MGSCASIHRNSDSAGKFRASLVHSEADKNPSSMPATPVKKNPANVLVVDRPIGYQFSNYGSKEEAFFDSQPWPESDCDDEFYSVNGDFTPSRGNTPVHSSRAGTPRSRTLSPQVNRALFESRSAVHNESNRQVDTNGFDSQEHGGSPPPPSDKKKKLADLFRESRKQNEVDGAEAPKSGNTTPYMSGTDSESSSAKRTPTETRPSEESTHCCFPRFKKTLFAAPPHISVDA